MGVLIGITFLQNGRIAMVLVLVLVLAALAVAAVAAAIWYLPRRDDHTFRDTGVEDPEKLAELRLSSRTSVIQTGGGFALIATLAVTAYQAHETGQTAAENIRVAEEGQVTDRLSRAVEELGTVVNGSPVTAARVGALFELARIGEDSKRDTQPALLIVASYIVGNLELPGKTVIRGSPCSRER